MLDFYADLPAAVKLTTIFPILMALFAAGQFAKRRREGRPIPLGPVAILMAVGVISVFLVALFF